MSYIGRLEARKHKIALRKRNGVYPLVLSEEEKDAIYEKSITRSDSIIASLRILKKKYNSKIMFSNEKPSRRIPSLLGPPRIHITKKVTGMDACFIYFEGEAYNMIEKRMEDMSTIYAEAEENCCNFPFFMKKIVVTDQLVPNGFLQASNEIYVDKKISHSQLCQISGALHRVDIKDERSYVIEQEGEHRIIRWEPVSPSTEEDDKDEILFITSISPYNSKDAQSYVVPVHHVFTSSVFHPEKKGRCVYRSCFYVEEILHLFYENVGTGNVYPVHAASLNIVGPSYYHRDQKCIMSNSISVIIDEHDGIITIRTF